MSPSTPLPIQDVIHAKLGKEVDQFCAFCYEKIVADSKYCGSCGSYLDLNDKIESSSSIERKLPEEYKPYPNASIDRNTGKKIKY